MPPETSLELRLRPRLLLLLRMHYHHFTRWHTKQISSCVRRITWISTSAKRFRLSILLSPNTSSLMHPTRTTRSRLARTVVPSLLQDNSRVLEMLLHLFYSDITNPSPKTRPTFESVEDTLEVHTIAQNTACIHTSSTPSRCRPIFQDARFSKPYCAMLSRHSNSVRSAHPRRCTQKPRFLS